MPTKTRRSNRTVPLPHAASTPSPTTCNRHGIRQVPLHGLRHTCVSLLLALGIHPRVVMEIVGHSAIEMTMNIYGHVNLDTQRAALDHLDEQLTD